MKQHFHHHDIIAISSQFHVQFAPLSSHPGVIFIFMSNLFFMSKVHSALSFLAIAKAPSTVDAAQKGGQGLPDHQQ